MNISPVNTNTYNNKIDMDTQAKLPTGAAGETVKAFESAFVRTTQSLGSTEITRTIEGITEDIGSVEEQLKQDAANAKAGLKALFNKMSGAEPLKLSEDGFDINDLDEEELITVVDRIKIMLAAYNENYRAFAGAFDMADSSELEQGEGASLAARVAAGLNEKYMPATEDNIKEVAGAMEMARDVAENMPLSDEAKAYLINNGLKPTIENVYKANHSTVNNGYRAVLTDDQWNQIKPQVEDILGKAGLLGNENNYRNARWLIENEIPVNGQNLIYKAELDKADFEYSPDRIMELAVSSMAGGEAAAEIELTDKETVWDKAVSAIRTVNTATIWTVSEITDNNRPFTIEEMADILKKQDEKEIRTDKEIDDKVFDAYRVLCETRLVMTASSAVSLINRGIDIYSEDLGRLKELLHEEEVRYIEEQLNRPESGRVSEEDLKNVADVNDVLMGLRFAPCAAIGRMTEHTELTLTSVVTVSADMKRQYEQAGRAYETMATGVRGDMGDSVKKAVNNSAEGILTDLNMEINDINLRAVRILAYNSMDMTSENIYSVRNIDSILTNLMENMVPQVVYGMIKDGINPMETDIAALNDYVCDVKDDDDASVKYSEYLYELERNKEIDADERKQYIGIYKMFHTLKKDGGKAVGALINQELPVNLTNLMMAVDSRKRYGMDVTLDTDTGLVDGDYEGAYYRNLFSGISKKITPSVLKRALEDETGENMSMEKLNEYIEEYSAEDDIKQEYYRKLATETEGYAEAEDEVIRMLTDNELPVTFYNLMAAGELAGKGSIYGKIKELKDRNVDSAVDRIAEALSSSEEIDGAFEGLDNSIEELKKQIMQSAGEDTYLDINSLKNIGKTVQLMKKLSGRQQYFIPFEEDGAIGGINLKIVRGEGETGKLEINFSTEAMGEVYAQMYMDGSQTTGYIVAGTDTGVETIRNSVDKIAEGMKELGISEVRIGISKGDEIPGIGINNEGNGVPTALMYKAARVVIAGLCNAGTNKNK